MKNKIPRYHILRIYIVGLILYFFLMMPLAAILFIQNSPEWFKPDEILFNPAETVQLIDSLNKNSIDYSIDSLKIPLYIDLVSKDTQFGCINADTNCLTGAVNYNLNNFDVLHNRENLLQVMLKGVLIISLIIGFFLNLPFRRYFRKLRKKREISGKLSVFVKRHLQHTPILNTAVLFVSFTICHVILKVYYIQNMTDHIEQEIGMHFFILSIVASFLTVLLVYNWHRYNMSFRYLHHVYTPEELKKNIFKKRTGSILKKMLWVSFMTAVFPISIVIFYISLSVSSLDGLTDLVINEDHMEVLFGKYVHLVPIYVKDSGTEAVKQFPYINVIDSALMMMGIATGIINALIYVIFFVKWTTSSIVCQVRELSANMIRTGAGERNVFTTVRTNDEIGELAEGYNVMSQQLQDYYDRISEMNRNLEQKVIERTAEIEKQKEEIETQRDEISAQRDYQEEMNTELVSKNEEISSQRDEIEAQRNMAVDQRNRISDQKKAMTDSIQYASRIQNAMMPQADDLTKYFPDSFIYYKPRDIVSGDFFWTTEKDNKLLVSAADCTGHGVPGALMSMIGIAFLNEIVNSGLELRAGIILDRLREMIIESLHQKQDVGSGVKDGMDISLLVIDLDDKDGIRKGSFAGAHNSLYLIRSGNDSPVLKEFKADKMPIGIYNWDVKPFTDYEVELQKGDFVYLFSDGYYDQFGGSRGKKFMIQPFKNLLLANANKPIEEILQALDKAHFDWKGIHEQIDDIVVMGIRI